MKKKLLAAVIIIAGALILTQTAGAADSIINPNTKEYAKGNYSLNSIVNLAIDASQWILGIVGSITLLMLVYGGLSFLLSAGDSGKVNQAKKIIGAAAIGLLIVFASYVIVKFSLQALGLNWSGGAIGSKSNSTQVETTTASTTTSGTDSCEQKYGAQGFQCMDKSQGGACKAGLCPGGADNQCCINCDSSLGSKGYSCIDTVENKGKVKNCQANLCYGDYRAAKFQCCQMK